MKSVKSATLAIALVVGATGVACERGGSQTQEEQGLGSDQGLAPSQEPAPGTAVPEQQGPQSPGAMDSQDEGSTVAPTQIPSDAPGGATAGTYPGSPDAGIAPAPGGEPVSPTQIPAEEGVSPSPGGALPDAGTMPDEGGDAQGGDY